MIVNNSDSPGLAEVIFVIECTAVNGAYINELKTNYILPTLEYFHGGALEEGGGHGSVYGIVTYQAADSLPGLPVTTYGPFTSPLNVSEAIDKLQFIGGMSESKACLTEALTAALSCFEELGRTEVVRHILLVCCSNPYTAAAGGIITPGAPATVEQAARLLGERGIHLSVAAARKAPSLLMIYEHAGGELAAAQQRNYAKDPRHLVLLRGYSLKERPPSPAPPPAPDVSSDIFGASRGAPAPAPPAVRGPTAAFTRAPPVRGNWLATRQPAIYANNSALLTQLAQPSYPPPTQPQQPNMPRMPLLGANAASNTATPVAASNAVPSSSAPVAGVPTIAAPAAGPSAQPTVPQRTFIWTGILEWMEKLKGDQQKVTKHLPCQVSVSSKDMEPELKVDAWPNKLLMQLMPKQLISNIGGQYLKDSKSVVFHLQPNEALEALTKVMVNGFAGCVHFTPMSSPPQCDIKVLILLYTPDKKAYLGFIPNNQATFVERLRKVIQQQKISQIIGKQVTGPVLPPGTLAPPGPGQAMGPGGAMGPGTAMGPNQTMAPSGSMGPTAGMGPSGAMGPSGNMGPGGTMGGVSGVGVGALAGVSTQAQGMVTPAQLSQHPQGMMMANSMGGQVGPVGPAKGQQVNQLDGLEAARQQNLEKIQHLQQTLAHQQEAQFKSQMDIMSHLQAAQQQEQHFKQLEVKEQQRKQQQLQHQLQQQLRGAGAHAPRGGLMRPIMPSNPGLRHLLQQQPQYRAGAARPPQPQQFDDVNGYNDFL